MSEPSRRSAAPRAHMIDSFFALSLEWKTAFGELIDNSLDADARRVQIEFESVGSRVRFTITDSGVGVKDLVSLVTYGAHDAHATTKSGRFGVGAIEALCWIGKTKESTVTITSTRDGKRQRLRVNWAELQRANWDIDPSWFEDVSDGGKGTTIEVYPAREPPHGADWARLLNALGYWYSAAIEDVRTITVRSHRKPRTEQAVTPWRLPPLEPGFVDQDITVDGKLAHVRVGIVQADHENEHCGITYTLGFRVIKESSGLGCGDAPIRRIAGIVSLSNPKQWKPGKNKTDVIDGEALYAEVERVCAKIIERVREEGETLQSREFDRLTSDALSAALHGPKDRKERRGKGSERGTVKPTDSGKKRKRASQTQSGDSIHGDGPAFKIDYERNSSGKFGRFEYGDRRVMLNENHPSVAQSRNVNPQAIVELAVFVIGSSVMLEPRQCALFKMKIDGGHVERLIEWCSRVLSDVRLDGAPVASEPTHVVTSATRKRDAKPADAAAVN